MSSPGEYELSVMLNDEFHIYGSPFTVLVSPSTAHAASCTAHGEGLSSAAPDVSGGDLGRF